MNLQIIHSTNGQPEFVLLPIKKYEQLPEKIRDELSSDEEAEYIPFVLENYVSSPIALLRIKAGVTQEELAEKMGVTQAYISKIERQKKVTAKTLNKINMFLAKLIANNEINRANEEKHT